MIYIRSFAKSSYIVRGVSLYLLVAAVLKWGSGSPADLPLFLLKTGYSPSLIFNALICMEFSLGILAFIFPHEFSACLFIVFFIFCGALVPLVIRGASSCGCFGHAINTSPVFTLALDLMIVIYLGIIRPWKNINLSRRRLVYVSSGAAVTLLVFIILPLFYLSGMDQSPTLSTGNDSYIPIFPEEWIGKRLADTEFSKIIGSQYLSFTGQMVLYKSDCEACAKHLSQLAHSAQSEQPPICLVYVPATYEHTSLIGDMPQGGSVLSTSLSDDFVYIVTTPVDIYLEGGSIISVNYVRHVGFINELQ